MRRAWGSCVVTLTLAIAGLIPAAVSGEIYRWTDARGRVHFTQHLDRVPADQRARAREAAEAVAPTSRFHTYESPASAAAPLRRRHDRELRIPFVRESSLMRVDVRLNDLVTAPFYVDTGASGVSLPSHVAEKLGIRVRSDMKHIQVHTAAGLVSRPIVTLRSVELGGARVEGLEATINPAMRVGLLGGEFFNNFVYRVDAAASMLYLEPNAGIRGGLGAKEWRERFRSAREPLARLEDYLETEKDLRRDDRARLERRRQELVQMLDELELRANKLDVPYKWRQ